MDQTATVMASIQDQLRVIELKVTQVGELLDKLKAENERLADENQHLRANLRDQKQVDNDQISLQGDSEDFVSKLNQAKKIKREVEQALRDAERRLEALRF